MIRDAASIVVVRHDRPEGPAVLLGRRAARAAFMPSKFVFPGGAVDAADARVPLAAPPGGESLRRLGEMAPALAAAAIRELWEETGLILGRRGAWPDPPAGWQGFAAAGSRPDAAGLRFIFRAITPPGAPRRFDARFFLADAGLLCCDPDDLSRADGELSPLQWVPLSRARQLDLPFITELVLAEALALSAEGPAREPSSVPFLDTRGSGVVLERLR
ncbi:NUDIX domain-containing protein [Paenirhodobacter populi]|uniref:NUDIX hydrolase n=1 Tax=Paenirhodobacter populi TaxID=2306993 RepID=A0A443IY83_9RHOB|nr:NUDIX hydrolase [Sinirhodobacter populi]RWR09422.1 NUDIX hydrolase [Sinirhodobacter populi]RWR12973.1 NUDIX hydrolase [Sinirhodobacter populi]